MIELWQLYDEQGRPLPGQGAPKREILDKAILHAAAHIWIWRVRDDNVELLLQKRAATKATWPNLYDISAAGHIQLGEEPIAAAIREVQEEAGLKISPEQLHFYGVYRQYVPGPTGKWVENEFTWLYLLELDHSTQLSLNKGEVSALEWRDLELIKTECTNGLAAQYVPHDDAYYELLFEALAKKTKGLT